MGGSATGRFGDDVDVAVVVPPKFFVFDGFVRNLSTIFFCRTTDVSVAIVGRRIEIQMALVVSHGHLGLDPFSKILL